MARLFTSGWELNSTTANMEFDFLSGGVSIDTGTVRTGTYSGKINLAGAGAFFQYQFSATSGTGPFFVKVAVNINTLPSAETDFIWLQQTSGSFLHCGGIYITATGGLKLYNFNATGVSAQVGSTSADLNTNQWYEIELKFDRSPASGSQVLEARIDGVVFATASNLTIGNSPGTLSIGGNGAGQTATGVWFFDDLAFNDSTGSFQTSYPGSGKVIVKRPNLAGASASWTRQGTDSGANFSQVNEVTPNDITAYVNTPTLNAEDLYNVEDSGIGASDTINVVSVGVRFRRNNTSASPVFKVELEKTGGGTIAQSTAITPTATTWSTNAPAVPHKYPLILYQDPDNTNWTQSTLDTTQIGQKLTATGGTTRIDVTAVWMVIDYTPAVVTSIPNEIVQVKQAVTRGSYY